MHLLASRSSFTLSLLTLSLTAHAFPFLRPRQDTAAAAAPAPAAAAAPAAAPDRTTWQGEESITDPDEECAAYDYAPVDAIIGYYPLVWGTANFSFEGVLDADAQVYTKISASIPAIQPQAINPTTGVVSSSSASSASTSTASDPYCWWTSTGCSTPKLAGLPPDIVSCPEPNTWGYTLDDGPNCSHNAFYDYLSSANQKATLFYIGANVADQPLEGQRGLADGHEICGHTWSHQYMTALTNEEVTAELYYSKKIIHDVLGITITCWRPPFGDVDDRVRWIANALGLTTVIWDNDTDDWNYAAVGVAGVEANYNAIIAGQANGSYSTHGTVVLSHEMDNETMSLAQQFLPQIQQTFTGGVMPVGVCNNWVGIYAEPGYQYPNYAQWQAGTRTISPPTPTVYSSEAPLPSGAIVTSA